MCVVVSRLDAGTKLPRLFAVLRNWVVQVLLSCWATTRRRRSHTEWVHQERKLLKVVIPCGAADKGPSKFMS